MAGLPDVPGPKLYPFDNGDTPVKIDFIEEVGHGLHSLIWKVRINGKEYALKIFTWYRTYGQELYGIEVPDDDYDGYFEPFQCECRAYGRLKEFGKEHLAALCYGYIILSDNTEAFAFLKQKYDGFQSSRRANWQYFEEEEYCREEPLRAIVKEFIDIPEDFESAENVHLTMNPKLAPKAIRDLKTLHKLGILVNDINSDNFYMGRYLDFSSAWTAPHPLFTKEKGVDFPPLGMASSEDAIAMDALIDEWNRLRPDKPIWHRCERDWGYLWNLRKRGSRRRSAWRYQPADFDYDKVKRLYGWKLRPRGQLGREAIGAT
ncbi:kinetochore Sim4 complex subunit FTA2-domain-containing protein [Xylariomycetidae sp. FL0641]|nr:kinetochore Sim4 complex subunit FTA2-domain-containing protein [Xylariomycetidae sp. FL0641]